MMQHRRRTETRLDDLETKVDRLMDLLDLIPVETVQDRRRRPLIVCDEPACPVVRPAGGPCPAHSNAANTNTEDDQVPGQPRGTR